jgi:hypothetical protein
MKKSRIPAEKVHHFMAKPSQGSAVARFFAIMSSLQENLKGFLPSDLRHLSSVGSLF